MHPFDIPFVDGCLLFGKVAYEDKKNTTNKLGGFTLDIEDN